MGSSRIFSSWASGIWPGAQQGLRWICQPCPPALARCVRAHGRSKVPLAGGPALGAWPGMEWWACSTLFLLLLQAGASCLHPAPIWDDFILCAEVEVGGSGLCVGGCFPPLHGGCVRGLRALGSCSSPRTSLASAVSSSGPGADVSTSVAWQWLQERTRGRAVVSQALLVWRSLLIWPSPCSWAWMGRRPRKARASVSSPVRWEQ